jgi:DNA-binding XRE family transcriptional regulator
VQSRGVPLTVTFPLESFVPMRRAIADWTACGLALIVLVLGGLVVIKPALDHWDDLYRGDPFEAGRTTQIVQKRSGEVDRTRTTTRESASSFPERLLGDSGVLLLRLALVALVAFLAAAVLQRAILGSLGLRPATRPAPASRAGAAANGVRVDDAVEAEPAPANGAQEGANLAPGIAKFVAARREALGLSQRELAKRAGISHTVISRIEGGEHSPSPKTLERLVDALG